jgi:hypothetical protein
MLTRVVGKREVVSTAGLTAARGIDRVVELKTVTGVVSVTGSMEATGMMEPGVGKWEMEGIMGVGSGEETETSDEGSGS